MMIEVKSKRADNIKKTIDRWKGMIQFPLIHFPENNNNNNNNLNEENNLNHEDSIKLPILTLPPSVHQLHGPLLEVSSHHTVTIKWNSLPIEFREVIPVQKAPSTISLCNRYYEPYIKFLELKCKNALTLEALEACFPVFIYWRVKIPPMSWFEAFIDLSEENSNYALIPPLATLFPIKFESLILPDEESIDVECTHLGNIANNLLYPNTCGNIPCTQGYSNIVEVFFQNGIPRVQTDADNGTQFWRTMLKAKTFPVRALMLAALGKSSLLMKGVFLNVQNEKSWEICRSVENAQKNYLMIFMAVAVGGDDHCLQFCRKVLWPLFCLNPIGHFHRSIANNNNDRAIEMLGKSGSWGYLLCEPIYQDIYRVIKSLRSTSL